MASELNVGGITTTGTIAGGSEIDAINGLDWAKGHDVAGRLGYGTNMVYVGSNDTNGILELRSGDGVTAATIDSAGLATFSNGIAFTQTGTAATGAATTSSTLDHYEEGTWTPTLHKGTSAALTPTNVYGHYVRVGKMIWLSGYFYKSSGTESTAGTWNIRGLPFNVPYQGPGSSYQFVTIGYSNMNGTNAYVTTQAPSRFQANTATQLDLYGVNGSTNWASGTIEFSFTGVLIVS